MLKRSFLLFLAAVLLVPHSSVEAGRRRRCRLQCPVVTREHVICPLYKYMSYGGYCSYYAVWNDTCNAVSYDSTNCSLSSGGCSDPPSGCYNPSFVDVNHPGDTGYYGPLLQYDAKPTLPGESPSQALEVTRQCGFVVKFKIGSTDAYAQIFEADVKVKASSDSPTRMRRGMQIAMPPSNIIPKYDFTLTTAPINASCVPTKDHKLSFDLGIPDQQLPVLIVLNAAPASGR